MYIFGRLGQWGGQNSRNKFQNFILEDVISREFLEKSEKWGENVSILGEKLT